MCVEASMNAIEMIKDDHRRIEALFSKFLETESDMTQEELFQEIQMGLNAHAEMEEHVLYPELSRFAQEQVDEALKEHAEVKALLDELLGADLDEDTFESQFNKLMEDVRHHIEEEEAQDGILELAHESFDDKKLSEMAKEMRNIQQRMRHDLAA
jgi:Hemerythrin HHE cation binding domain